jgi:ERCC4-type nuclease
MSSARIVVDSRERGLAALLPEADVQQLNVGDVIVGDRILFERKTPSDLEGSILDGRWRDQLARMVKAREEGGYRPAVLIEGRIPVGDGGDRLRSAATGAFVRDGIPCFETDGAVELAAFVRSTAKRVAGNEPPSSQRALAKRSSGLMSSPQRVAVAQLSVIPGLSDRTAEALLGHCSCLSEWVALWAAIDPEMRRTAFAETRPSGGRRIGKSVAERVNSLMF